MTAGAALIRRVIDDYRPEAVMHPVEQGSAPYSMIGRGSSFYTQHHNPIGTHHVLFAIAQTDRGSHTAKVGTISQHGTLGIAIEEGRPTIECNRTLHARYPGSHDHFSTADNNPHIEFAYRVCAPHCTDLGLNRTRSVASPPSQPLRSATCSNYDAVFAATINRFVAQALRGMALTLYSAGRQVCGFIELHDRLEWVHRACDHLADHDEFRICEDTGHTVAACDVAPIHTDYRDNSQAEHDDRYRPGAHTGLADVRHTLHRPDETADQMGVRGRCRSPRPHELRSDQPDHPGARQRPSTGTGSVLKSDVRLARRDPHSGGRTNTS